jgi:D-alanyl-D-alanine carboxypeptidase
MELPVRWPWFEPQEQSGEPQVVSRGDSQSRLPRHRPIPRGEHHEAVVATVVLQLVAEGRSRRLGQQRAPGLIPNGAAITIRELLNHTSGLFDYTTDAGFAGGDRGPRRYWSPRALSRSRSRTHPVSPGTSWSYSNTNYVVLGFVIEAVGATTLDAQLQRRIFRPLALSATGPASPRRSRASTRTATSLCDAAIAVRPAARRHIAAGPFAGWAAGGIVSTATT